MESEFPPEARGSDVRRAATARFAGEGGGEEEKAVGAGGDAGCG